MVANTIVVNPSEGGSWAGARLGDAQCRPEVVGGGGGDSLARAGEDVRVCLGVGEDSGGLAIDAG